MHRVPCILAACCSLTTDVARSVVCVSVCWSHGWTAQKRLNRLRCRLGAQSCWLKEPWVGSRSRSLPREGAILAVVWPFEKHWESLPRCMYATEGIIQSSVTAWQRDCCSRLQCSRLVDVSVTLHCPPWKIRPCNAAFHQNSLTTCCIWLCCCVVAVAYNRAHVTVVVFFGRKNALMDVRIARRRWQRQKWITGHCALSYQFAVEVSFSGVGCLHYRRLSQLVGRHLFWRDASCEVLTDAVCRSYSRCFMLNVVVVYLDI